MIFFSFVQNVVFRVIPHFRDFHRNSAKRKIRDCRGPILKVNVSGASGYVLSINYSRGGSSIHIICPCSRHGNNGNNYFTTKNEMCRVIENSNICSTCCTTFPSSTFQLAKKITCL